MSLENGASTPPIQKRAREDRFQGHDYYNIDELLSEDHLLARDAVRTWVKQEVTPIIEEYADRAQCPTHLFKGLAEIGAFGPLETYINHNIDIGMSRISAVRGQAGDLLNRADRISDNQGKRSIQLEDDRSRSLDRSRTVERRQVREQHRHVSGEPDH